MNQPKVSIIILNWNSLEDTTKCLESLQKITYPNYEVILVDNGSDNNEAEMLKKAFGSYVRIIANDQNYGFAGGNNIGMRYALNHSNPDYFLLLNNDTIVDPEFLTEMVKVAEMDSVVAVVGPKIYLFDMPNRFWLTWFRLNMFNGRISLIGAGEIDRGQYDQTKEVDYVSGCCFLIGKEAVKKVGMLDESYFCYWEETDYCFRIKKAGYKIMYAPAAKIWHKKMIKLKPAPARTDNENKSGESPRVIYFLARNNFKFMKKYATPIEYLSFLIYFFGYRFWFITAVDLLYYRSLKKLSTFYRGVRDGLLI